MHLFSNRRLIPTLATYPDYASAMAFGEQWDEALHTLFADPEATAQQKVAAKTVYQDLKIKRRAFNYGGDHFFIPSLTALRMIGEGIIDPT